MYLVHCQKSLHDHTKSKQGCGVLFSFTVIRNIKWHKHLGNLTGS